MAARSGNRIFPTPIGCSLREVRELEENNIRISCRTFVRFQGVIAGASQAMCLLSQRGRWAKGQTGCVDYFLEVPLGLNE